MNILLDVYLEKNLGDDLFLISILERYPHIDFYAYTQTDYSDIEEKYLNFKVISYNKYYNYMLIKSKGKNYIMKLIEKKYSIDALVVIGGSLFIESSNWKDIFNERKDLWSHFYFCNKNIFIIGSNFGPYESSNFEQDYKNLFRIVKDICFRDNYSFNLFKDLPNVRIAPDAIFSYKLPKKAKKCNCLGISVIDLTNRQSLVKYVDIYETFLVNTMKKALNNYDKVYLLSFCQSEGDEKQINLIKNKYFSNNNRVLPLLYKDNMNEFLEIFGSFRTVVATRFHSIVLSILSEISFITLNYSKKSENLINDYGIPVKKISITELENINSYTFLENVNYVKDTSYLIEFAEKQYDVLDQFLKNK